MAVRLFRWSMLMLAAVIGGIALGEMTIGSRARIGGGGEPASYSHLSANPQALMPQGDGAAPCLDCPDSYAVAARMRARRDDRMSDEFRELGAVDVDPPIRTDPDDGYRYGGRFPDPPSAVVATDNAAPAFSSPLPSTAGHLVQAAKED